MNYDTTPGYNDTAPMPAALTKWKYKAIDRVGDQRVGLWSNEATLTVGGYGKCTGGAADAPIEETKDGDAFRRFSAFLNDNRIRSDGSVYPGTYATTAEDGDKVKTGLESVERYALPNPMPASYRFAIQPHKDTVIKKGIAQPAYGHQGGGVEVFFVEGTQPKTVTGMKRIPDK